MANEDVSMVEPKSMAAPAAEPVEAAAPEGGVDLPEDLLRIPAMQAVMVGQPGAFSAILSDLEKTPEAKILSANKDALMGAGFGFYRSLDGAKGAVFNQRFVSPEEIQAADQAGQLETVAPPFGELNAAVAASGASNPVLAEGMEQPEGFKSGMGAAPVGGGSTMPASAQKTLANARARNLQPGAPASGPRPGAGRLQNAILKNVI